MRGKPRQPKFSSVCSARYPKRKNRNAKQRQKEEQIAQTSYPFDQNPILKLLFEQREDSQSNRASNQSLQGKQREKLVTGKHALSLSSIDWPSFTRR